MRLTSSVSRWLHTTRARLTLLFGGTAVATGLAVGLLADELLTRQLTDLSGQSLMNSSQPIALALAQGMQEREREISLLSHLPMLTQGSGYDPQLQAHLEQIRQSYPFYSWIGVTDTQGVVQVATGNLLQGQDVSQRPWFGAGGQGPYVGDAHDAVLLDKLLRAPGSQVPLRFMDYASPVRGQDSAFKGVIAAHVNWAWVQDIIQRASPASPLANGLEVMLVNKDGVINTEGAVDQPRASLPILPEPGAFRVMSWGGASPQPYLTAVVSVRAQTATDLGWLLVTRQPLEMALQPISRLHTLLALLLGLMAALLAGLAYAVARRFSQPLERLAKAAQEVQATGQVAALHVDVKTLEFQHLRSALENMAQGLLEGRAALQSANAELEQRVAERTQALHQSEQRYLSILEDQTEMICRFDASNRMTFVNEAFCRLFHLRRDEVVGQVWAPIVHPDDLPMVTRALQGVSPAQPLVVVENRVVAGDGAIRWCQFSNRALYDDDGQLVEWQSVGRDVTERRQLEAELAQASEQFQDLYDHAPCGYYALDRQGKYVHLNLLTLQWLGLPREEVIGKLGPADFFDDEGKALFNACFPVFLQNGKIGRPGWRAAPGERVVHRHPQCAGRLRDEPLHHVRRERAARRAPAAAHPEPGAAGNAGQRPDRHCQGQGSRHRLAQPGAGTHLWLCARHAAGAHDRRDVRGPRRLSGLWPRRLCGAGLRPALPPAAPHAQVHGRDRVDRRQRGVAGGAGRVAVAHAGHHGHEAVPGAGGAHRVP